MNRLVDRTIRWLRDALSPKQNAGGDNPPRVLPAQPGSSARPHRQIAADVEITDLETGVSRRLTLGEPGEQQLEPGDRGWSVGEPGSGAQIEIDEDLHGFKLGIFPASNHLILGGRVAPGSQLPVIARGHEGSWSGEPPDTGKGTLYFRFDHLALRIGRHAIQLTIVFPD